MSPCAFFLVFFLILLMFLLVLPFLLLVPAHVNREGRVEKKGRQQSNIIWSTCSRNSQLSSRIESQTSQNKRWLWNSDTNTKNKSNHSHAWLDRPHLFFGLINHGRVQDPENKSELFMLHKLLNYISPGEAVSHSLLFFILPQGPKLASAAGLTYVPLAHGSAGFAILDSKLRCALPKTKLNNYYYYSSYRYLI